jgi:hypothetical protein
MVLLSPFRTRSARRAQARRSLLDALESRVHLTATIDPLPHADTAYLAITSGHELDGFVSARSRST